MTEVLFCWKLTNYTPGTETKFIIKPNSLHNLQNKIPCAEYRAGI